MTRDRSDLFADQRLPAPMGPGAHRSDPVTSREAAEAKRQSPTLGEDQALALRLVRRYPGSTCVELAGRARQQYGERGSLETEHWRQRIGRRLSELARQCWCGHPGGDQPRSVHVPAGDVFADPDACPGMGGCMMCECEKFNPIIEAWGTARGPSGRPAVMWWPREGE